MKKGLTAILILCLIIAGIAIAGIVGYTKFKDKLIFTTKTTQQSFPKESLDIAPCDVNADGKCNVADLDLLEQALETHRGQSGYIPLADLNADGVINDIDKQTLLKLLDQEQASETADWKTYTDKEFGASFKHPETFFISNEATFPIPETSSKFFSLGLASCNLKVDSDCARDKNEIMINITSYESSQTPEETVSDTTKGVSDIKNKIVTTLDNESAIRYSIVFSGVTDPEGVAYIGDHVVSKHRGKVYTVSFGINAGAKSDNLGQATKIFNQILSTFKFL